MQPPTDNSTADTLQMALLAYLRKDYVTARDLVEPVVQDEPDNVRAHELLDKIARAQVKDELSTERRNGWLEGVDLNPKQLESVVAFGLLFIIIALVFAIPAIKEGFNIGFSKEVVVITADEALKMKQHPFHAPLHNLLIYPTIFFAVGAGLLYFAFRYKYGARE